MTDKTPQSSNLELKRVLRDAAGYVRKQEFVELNGYECDALILVEEIERLTRERDERYTALQWQELRGYATGLQTERDRLRAALERVCNVDKAAPGRKDWEIWAEMLAEAADALRPEDERADVETEKDRG